MKIVNEKKHVKVDNDFKKIDCVIVLNILGERLILVAQNNVKHMR